MVVAVLRQAATGAQARFDAGDEGVEIRRIRFVDRGEHQALPHAHRQLRQDDVGRIEVLRRAHLRRGAQDAVERVGPAVVLAVQRARTAAVLQRKRPGAVTADVRECPKPAVVAAHKEYRHVRDGRDHVIARTGEVGGVRDELPAAREHRAAVLR